MKSAQVVRKVDELGRIVIPIELRRMYDIDIGNPIEILVNQDMIILKKYYPKCEFCCSSSEKIHEHLGKNICSSCLEMIKKL